MNDYVPLNDRHNARFIIEGTLMMSVTFPNEYKLDSRLVSPLVNVTSQSCLSFIVAYNTYAALLEIGFTDVINYNGFNYTTIGIAHYPFISEFNYTSANSSIYRMQLNIPPGSYHVIFSAESSGGSVAVDVSSFLSFAVSIG